jgi:phosphoribosyl 1,2-cyclic phosphodiesterase
MAPLLIDCGVSYRAIQEAMDFKTHSLAGCLVSHGHGDHCAAVRDLIVAGVNVYGSKGFWENYRNGIYQDHHRAYYLQDQYEEQVGSWTVLPFDVLHDPGTQTQGFLVANHKHKLLYLTDAAWSPHRFVGLTHIAIEANWSEELLRKNSREGKVHAAQFRHVGAGHQSIERVVRFFQKMREVDPDYDQRLECVWLIHLSDDNSDEEEFKRLVRAETGCHVEVAAKNSRQEVPF